MANPVLVSLKSEIKKLCAAQDNMQASSGASIMHVHQRLELLDRMLSLMERQQLLQAGLDTSPQARAILLKKIEEKPASIAV